MYSSDITTVTAIWERFIDYESGITEYSVTVTRKQQDSIDYEPMFTSTVDGSINEIRLNHFSFGNGDSIVVEVSSRNGAGRLLSSPILSSPYVIDLTPPHISSLVDGSDINDDIESQSSSDQLTISWSVEDDESQIKKTEIAILEQLEGRLRLIYPDPIISGQSSVEINSMLTEYTIQNLSLVHGAKYIAVLTITNGAGLISEGRSSGVLVDLTSPLVTYVQVDGHISFNEVTENMEVIVYGTDKVRAWWRAVDVESGIGEILVGIVDVNNTLVTTELMSYHGYSTGGVIDGLNLQFDSHYRLIVIAINQALGESLTTYSQEFR